MEEWKKNAMSLGSQGLLIRLWLLCANDYSIVPFPYNLYISYVHIFFCNITILWMRCHNKFLWLIPKKKKSRKKGQKRINSKDDMVDDSIDNCSSPFWHGLWMWMCSKIYREAPSWKVVEKHSNKNRYDKYVWHALKSQLAIWKNLRKSSFYHIRFAR